MGALGVVVNEPAVQIRLQRINGLVEGFPQGGLEELLFDRAVEAFDEAIGLPRPDLGAPLLDRVEREIELEEPAAAPGRVRPVQDGDRLFESEYTKEALLYKTAEKYHHKF